MALGSLECAATQMPQSVIYEEDADETQHPAQGGRRVASPLACRSLLEPRSHGLELPCLATCN